MTILLGIIALITCLILFYLSVIRPWHLRWGATSKEVALSLSGDEIVQNPDFNATRGITIQASPEQIWRWIIQIGSKRAGWYNVGDIIMMRYCMKGIKNRAENEIKKSKP